jgi:hypothetical protein
MNRLVYIFFFLLGILGTAGGMFYMYGCIINACGFFSLALHTCGFTVSAMLAGVSLFLTFKPN